MNKLNVPLYDFSQLDILVVDDNQFMRRVVESILKVLGFKRIALARGGEAALEMTQRHPFDLIITDLEMDEGSGLALLHKLRTQEDMTNSTVPIIVMSGNTTSNAVIAARNQGATEFLAKPVSAEALVTRINNIVAKPRPYVRTGDYFGPDRRRARKRVIAGKLRRASDG